MTQITITPDYVKSFVTSMALGSTEPATIKSEILKYVSPNYIQDRSGKISSFEEAISHLSQVRGKITSLSLEVKNLIVAEGGRQFASRHTAVVNGNNQGKTTVVMFVDLDEDGKIEKVYEMAS
jgi:hypothetical protein